MTKKLINGVLALVLVAFTASCKNDTKEAKTGDAETVAVSEGASQKFVVNVEESLIQWKGFKPTGSHNGSLKLDNGVFQINNGVLESGSFLIDMNSISVEDLPTGEGKEDLEAHLKGTVEGKKDHFFDVQSYPTADFEITGVETLENGKMMLSGNLTIKGKKNNISFPVEFSDGGNVVKLISETFTIDRTKWNVNYGSKSIFDNLGDKFINDDMELTIILKAEKS